MTSSSTIISEVDAFVAQQNVNRGQTLKSGAVLSLDYDALTTTIPTGGNAVTGIAGITSGAAAITLPSSQNGNAVILDGIISTTASTSGADGYSVAIATTGVVTLTDNNTGYSQTISNADYIVTNGAASTGSTYIIETGTNAEMAAMYNAAYGRIPDLAGLEFYIDQFGSSVLPDLHTMATYFLSSKEFQTHWPSLQTTPDDGGPNDQAYISALYGQILHRTPSASEMQFYINALQGTLTTSTGAAIPACDRAQLLVYFSISPENTADISATNGGWLINTASTTYLGAISTTNAQTLLASEAATGTINSSDFSGMSTTSFIHAVVGNGSVGIFGEDSNGTNNPVAPGISSTASNVTLDLSTAYNEANMSAAQITVNGLTTGGSIVVIEQEAAVVIGSTQTIPAFLGSGTINLSGDQNWIQTQSTYSTTMPALVVTSVVNGWNSSDILVGNYATLPGPQYTASTLIAQNDGVVYQGNASAPISGSALGANWFIDHQLAINVGTLANDSLATLATAANKVYIVGDVGSVTSANGENAFFYGTDAQGNTILGYWHGDSGKTGTVQASDFVGALELVGIAGSSLTAANFHH